MVFRKEISGLQNLVTWYRHLIHPHSDTHASNFLNKNSILFSKNKILVFN
jgi:hypothetical protein